MIVTIRVDDRLIHGQVALLWTKKLQADGIVVANDAAATNETQQMTLKMAAPYNVKLTIKTIEDSVKLLNNPKADKMRIFVLVNSIKDARNLVGKLDGKGLTINIANAGRFDGEDISKKMTLTKTVLVSDSELVNLKTLIDSENDVILQTLPDEPIKMAADLLKSHGK
ncbi:PTS system, mannose-specific IIB component [Enterococcus sp. AZ135]|uniref:PTS sugar transporter subunit IIB n=1 Tax=unclassified Enterococcus TaxID=2608891 RepID=UPI003F1E6514